jgi:hypothetical protein
MDPSLLPEPEPRSRRQIIAAGATLTLGLGTIGSYVWKESGKEPQTASVPKSQTSQPAKEPRLPQQTSKPTHPPEPKPERKPLPLERDFGEFIASLDLLYISPREVVSPHIRELKGVCNELPPRELWNNIVSTLRIADELRDRLGVKLRYFSSVYRSPSYNAAVAGAASRSQHVQNRALDIIYDCDPKVAMKEALAMRQEGIFKGGLGLYSGFIHIDTRGRNATW